MQKSKGMRTRKQAKDADPFKIAIMDALWKAERHAIDEDSYEALRVALACIHKRLQQGSDYLGLMPVNADDQTVPFPFSENGDPNK